MGHPMNASCAGATSPGNSIFNTLDDLERGVSLISAAANFSVEVSARYLGSELANASESIERGDVPCPPPSVHYRLSLLIRNLDEAANKINYNLERLME